jgi:alpha-tubulin suppressor-like RCC1 family protein
MKTLGRYIAKLLPAATLLITLCSWQTCFGGTAQVAAGANHTIFLRSDGTLWGAGLNVAGELGDGTFTDRPSPVRIGAQSNWTAVAAGADFNLALRSDGTLWSWGSNDFGELGRTLPDGSPVPDQNTPQQVGSARDWIAVAASSGGSSYALKGNGTLWAWGNNSDGRLGAGDGAGLQVNQPVQVLNPSASNSPFVAVAAGGGHALALQADGSLWAWGANAAGELGVGGADGSAHATPVQVILAGEESDNDWSGIAAGSVHSLALKSDGTLWSFGGNGSGQLGNGSNQGQSAPLQVGLDHDWARLAAGSLHSLAVKRNGTIWSFGDNRSGQLGNGSTLPQNVPVQAGAGGALEQVLLVSGGEFHSIALKSNGTIYAFGDNGTGQYGNGGTTGSLSPLPVGSDALGWVASEPGNQFTVARRANGTLWGWGDNASGQLGLGAADELPHTAPAQIGADSNWAAHSAGLTHVVALRSDGTLWGWGGNSLGQLGDNTLSDRLTPTQIRVTSPGSATNDWAAVAAGDNHTLALKGDGTLWSWGDNSSGQLGSGGSTGPVKRPKQLVTGNPGNFDNNWVAIAAGGGHSLGLQGDGTLWAWGDNALGQLGDPGVVGSIATPNQVINFTPPSLGFNTGWKGIAAGFEHSLALQGDGTLWAFGSNFSGQLGNGDSALPHPANQPLPVQVLNAGGSPYVALAAGDAHSAARRADGTLWSFGSNTSGQLGIGSSDPDPFNPVSHASPLQEGGAASDWAVSGVGGSHSIALKAGGTLWGWGSNFSGQLGDGSTVDRSLPAPFLEAFASVAASLDLGAVALGGSAATGNLKLANPGNGVLFVTGVSLSGNDAALFGVSAGSCPAATSFTLPANGSCQLQVSAAPAASPGGMSALLSIDSSSLVQPQVRVALAARSVSTLLVTTSASPVAGGAISPSGPVQALPGTSPVFSITANAGYHLTDVTVDGVSRGATGSVTLTSIAADTAIAAFFAPNPHSITLSAGAHGSISGPTSVQDGATPSFSITPDAGAFITDVTVNGVSQGAVSALTLAPVTADVTVAASFGVTTFTVSAAGDARGSVTPAGAIQVPYGSSQSFTFTPNAGYQVVNVVVDGVPQGALPSYTFSNVTANGHTLKVSFIPDGDLNGDGRVDIADALRALQIAVALFEATPAELLHGDVAPLDASGVPAPDGSIGVADALVILRKAVGLVSGF